MNLPAALAQMRYTVIHEKIDVVEATQLKLVSSENAGNVISTIVNAFCRINSTASEGRKSATDAHTSHRNLSAYDAPEVDFRG